MSHRRFPALTNPSSIQREGKNFSPSSVGLLARERLNCRKGVLMQKPPFPQPDPSNGKKPFSSCKDTPLAERKRNKRWGRRRPEAKASQQHFSSKERESSLHIFEVLVRNCIKPPFRGVVITSGVIRPTTRRSFTAQPSSPPFFMDAASLSLSSRLW